MMVVDGKAYASAANNGALTEDAAALHFAGKYRDRLLFCHDHGKWFEWSGAHWRQDNTGLAFDLARSLSRTLAEDEAPRVKALAEKTAFVRGVEQFARHDRVFAATADMWDNDPFLLGTPGGTVDLHTGNLLKADPSSRITKITAVVPAEKAECPLWLQFLNETTGSDVGLIRFLQQWLGYSLTGDTREHALVFIYGPGGNGKSVLLNTVSRIALDYMVTAAMDTFTASVGDRHPTDVAMLRGARLVTASETEEGRAWAEARIKAMTGGDPITAHFMRQDNFTYQPRFKLTVIGNHRPVLRNVDDAARRRFNVVPFTRKPASPDRELETKLMAEAPAILRWMIDGCLDWQRNGLVRPASVLAETAAYFSDQDLFGQWLEDECDVEPGNTHKWETASLLFEAWTKYATAAGEKPGSKRAFGDLLQSRQLEPHRGHGGTRQYRGIRFQRGTATG